jgi:triacylglycerol lipase
MLHGKQIDSMSHFSLRTARRLAKAAELVYEDPEMVEQTVVERWKATSFCFADVESTQAFVSADHGSIIVCFRGTEPDRPEDWIADLGFDLVDGPMGGRVHAGFYDALSMVWDSIDRQVCQLQAERPRRLWVTGHSLGAALATLAVARWRDNDLPVAGLYTFGQPRTGDRTFARNFDFAFRPHAFRIVNHLDIVTRTPPRSLGYRHLGNFVYFTESGEMTNDVDWWQRFLDGWTGAIDAILDWGGEGIEDHRMVHYCSQLEQVSTSCSSWFDHTHFFSAAAHEIPSPSTLVTPRRRAA